MQLSSFKKFVLPAALFSAGFATSRLFPVIKKEKETVVEYQTQTVTKTLPSKIVYKDKVRTIEATCPSQETYQNVDVKSILKQDQVRKYKFRAGFMVNPKLDDIRLGAGYFIMDNISIDLQTTYKFDKILFGASLYF